jgi:hypothetical protein
MRWERRGQTREASDIDAEASIHVRTSRRMAQ